MTCLETSLKGATVEEKNDVSSKVNALAEQIQKRGFPQEAQRLKDALRRDAEPITSHSGNLGRSIDTSKDEEQATFAAFMATDEDITPDSRTLESSDNLDLSSGSSERSSLSLDSPVHPPDPAITAAQEAYDSAKASYVEKKARTDLEPSKNAQSIKEFASVMVAQQKILTQLTPNAPKETKAIEDYQRTLALLASTLSTDSTRLQTSRTKLDKLNTRQQAAHNTRNTSTCS